MKIRQNAVRALAATALGLTVTAAGLVSTTGTAQAASLPRGCELIWQDYYKTTANVNLRSGPGTKYASLGILTKGTRIYEYCTKDLTWYYGKVTSGANKGKKGWVRADYLYSQKSTDAHCEPPSIMKKSLLFFEVNRINS